MKRGSRGQGFLCWAGIHIWRWEFSQRTCQHCRKVQIKVKDDDHQWQWV